MRPFIFFIFFVCGYSFAGAQTFPFDLWHDGKLVLDTGDTLRGSIKYNLEDLLQVRHHNRLESFSARKILYFEIFDQYYHRYRQFYSLPFSANGSYKTPLFFELLAEGKITVLSREKVEYRSYNYSPFFYGGYVNRLVLVNTYYLLKENGNIENFSGKKDDWYELMHTREDDIRQFAKGNRLDFDRKYDLKKIIEYYNSFFPR
ncbi:MAG: hypothetical protein JST43_12970 [Bacteroidetes bacterium]|nr:hypothetical protein [Bacteroidota bacterium]MBS1541518.1 hypothetical protein [Bacteroidota bacterium]